MSKISPITCLIPLATYPIELVILCIWIMDLREWIQVVLLLVAVAIMRCPMRTASGRRNTGIRSMQDININTMEPEFNVRINNS